MCAGGGGRAMGGPQTLAIIHTCHPNNKHAVNRSKLSCGYLGLVYYCQEGSFSIFGLKK